NDLVDRLAVEAATTQVPRAGHEPPSALGPADRPGAGGAGATDDDEPVVAGVGPSPAMGTSHQLTGHPVVVLGHRPPALGGYDDNPALAALRDRLREALAAKATLHDDLHVVCGLRLGTEQLAAEAALDLGLPLDVVLPYPDPE